MRKTELSSDMRVNPCAALLLLLLLACPRLLAVDLRDVEEKHGSHVKKRLSLQSTGEFEPQGKQM